MKSIVENTNGSAQLGQRCLVAHCRLVSSVKCRALPGKLLPEPPGSLLECRLRLRGSAAAPGDEAHATGPNLHFE